LLDYICSVKIKIINIMKGKILILIYLLSLLLGYAFTLNEAASLIPKNESVKKENVKKIGDKLSRLQIYINWGNMQEKKLPKEITDEQRRRIGRYAQEALDLILEILREKDKKDQSAIKAFWLNPGFLSKARTDDMQTFEDGGEEAVLKDIEKLKKEIIELLKEKE